MRRTSASATSCRASSRRCRSGSASRPSNLAAPARRTETVAAIASAFSSRHSSREWSCGTRNVSSQSSSSASEASAAVGPVGPAGRCGAARKLRRRPATASRAAAVDCSRGSAASARSARALTARAASSRSAERGRAGQSSMCAQIPAPAASAHPSSRAGSADTGAAIVTGRTNVRIAEVPAAAQ